MSWRIDGVTPADSIDDHFCIKLELGQCAGNGRRDLFHHVFVSSTERSIGFLEGDIKQERESIHDKGGASSANTKDDAAHYAEQQGHLRNHIHVFNRRLVFFSCV